MIELNLFLRTASKTSRSFCRSVKGNSISDHLTYYGVEMGCDASSSCRIVMDPRIAAYGRTDLDGNLIFSREPSPLKLSTDRGDQ